MLTKDTRLSIMQNNPTSPLRIATFDTIHHAKPTFVAVMQDRTDKAGAAEMVRRWNMNIEDRKLLEELGVPTAKYQSTYVRVFAEEDVFGEGCLPDTGFEDGYSHSLSGDTLEEWLEAACQHCLWRSPTPDDYQLDACEEPGRVDIQGMIDERGHPATVGDIKLWKEGKRKLFAAIHTFHIELVTRSTPSLT